MIPKAQKPVTCLKSKRRRQRGRASKRIGLEDLHARRERPPAPSHRPQKSSTFAPATSSSRPKRKAFGSWCVPFPSPPRFMCLGDATNTRWKRLNAGSGLCSDSKLFLAKLSSHYLQWRTNPSVLSNKLTALLILPFAFRILLATQILLTTSLSSKWDS